MYLDPEIGVTAETVYRTLASSCDPDLAEEFDRHVVTCIMSLALFEVRVERVALSDRTGLDARELAHIARTFFPHTSIDPGPDKPVQRGVDEACLVDLLTQCATDGSPLQSLLAAMIARRAQSPNHLWQDLGLRHRGDLNRLMMRHFRPLAMCNTSDMKWKKFLYRMVCRDAGYALCTAPSCSECCDFEACFGDESGESRLARVRLAHDLGAT